MPQIIWTFSDYFYHKQRDLYFFTFDNHDKPFIAPNHEAREALLAWFAEHLPHLEIKPIFRFFADDGMILCPYDGTIYVDFDEESLAQFTAEWADENGGSLDPRLQCWLYPLESYRKKYNGEIPNPEDFYSKAPTDYA